MSPDDICAVCGTTRENHGDVMHEFDMEDPFPRNKRPGPTPHREPPKERSATGGNAIDVQQVGDSFATLLEVLAEKGIITAPDIIRILSAHR